MEDYIEQLYLVYIKRNEYCEIDDVNSSAFLNDTTGWDQIDAGYGDRFHHAQGNYFSKPLKDDNGVRRYCAYEEEYEYESGEHAHGWEIIERTDEEMAELYEPPVPQPSNKERIKALEDQLAAYEEAYAEGVNEA